MRSTMEQLGLQQQIIEHKSLLGHVPGSHASATAASGVPGAAASAGGDASQENASALQQQINEAKQRILAERVQREQHQQLLIAALSQHQQDMQVAALQQQQHLAVSAAAQQQLAQQQIAALGLTAAQREALGSVR